MNAPGGRIPLHFNRNPPTNFLSGAQVRVSQNLPSINEVLRAAMPEANVRVVNVGQVAILTGIVASPEDSAFATQLAGGATYSVSVLSPPLNPYQNCVIANAGGIVGAGLSVAPVMLTNVDTPALAASVLIGFVGS